MALITVDAPNTSDFQSLQQRVAELEAAVSNNSDTIANFQGGGSIPELLSSPVTERYTSMPVETDSSGRRTILYVAVSDGIAAGEIWDVDAMIHVTNNDLRSVGRGLHCTTEIRCGYDTSHDRDGFSLAPDSGSFNVGVEAHHALINRRGIYRWEQDEPDTRIVKFIIWAGSSQSAIDEFSGGPRCEITPNRGHLRMLRHRPNN